MRVTRTSNDALRRPSRESLAARAVRGSASAILIGLTFYSPAPVRAAASAPLRLVALRTEYKENPLGIDARKPRLSWQLASAGRGVRQSAYEIRVARSEAAVRGGRDLVWTSGRVASDESTQRAYEGPALQSGQRYHWQVRVWDGGGTASAWSAPAYWEMGLLEPSDWKASWIEPDLPGGREDQRARTPAAPRLQARRGRRARAGLRHEPRPLRAAPERPARGRPALHPGVDELQQAPAVPDLRRDILIEGRGQRRWASLLGNGWYRGNLGWEDRRNLYGDRLALLCQIEITYKDGRKENGRKRRELEGRDRAPADVRDLPRRDLRRAPREGGLDVARLRRSASGQASRSSTIARTT